MMRRSETAVYQSLDYKPDSYRLPVRPVELWHVATLGA